MDGINHSNTLGLQDRLRSGDVLAKECPSRNILRDVTNRWGVLILLALQGEKYRFSDLRRRVSGVSEKMLSQTLQALEADGFVLRTAYPVIPPHVEYSLTPLGEEITEKVKELTNWIEGNLLTILECRRFYEERNE